MDELTVDDASISSVCRQHSASQANCTCNIRANKFFDVAISSKFPDTFADSATEVI